MQSIDVFTKMTSLRKLDISDHPEFLMTPEMKEANEFKALHGIAKEKKKEVEFQAENLSIDDILQELKAVEILKCDEDLETHILENRINNGFLPALKLLNGVSIEVTSSEERTKEKEAVSLMNRIFQLANCYAIQAGATQ